MEMLMYSRGYGEDIKSIAAKMFEQIPVEIQEMIPDSDYSQAEKMCPQRMPIAELMQEAYLEFRSEYNR